MRIPVAEGGLDVESVSFVPHDRAGDAGGLVACVWRTPNHLRVKFRQGDCHG